MKMKRTFLILMSFIILSGTVHAQTETLQSKAELLAQDPVFSHASIGICVRNAAGSTLAEVNRGKMLVPASNMKLISTGAALHGLGPNYQYSTSIQYDGVIEKGILHGNGKGLSETKE